MSLAPGRPDSDFVLLWRSWGSPIPSAGVARFPEIQDWYEREAVRDRHGAGRMALVEFDPEGVWLTALRWDGERELVANHRARGLAARLRSEDVAFPPLLRAFLTLVRAQYRRGWSRAVSLALGLKDATLLDERGARPAAGDTAGLQERMTAVEARIDAGLAVSAPGEPLARYVVSWLEGTPFRWLVRPPSAAAAPRVGEGRCWLAETIGAPSEERPARALALRRCLRRVEALDPDGPEAYEHGRVPPLAGDTRAWTDEERDAFAAGLALGALEAEPGVAFPEQFEQWLRGDDRTAVGVAERLARAGGPPPGRGLLAAATVAVARSARAAPEATANLLLTEVLAHVGGPPARLDVSRAFTPFDWAFLGIQPRRKLYPVGTRLLWADPAGLERVLTDAVGARRPSYADAAPDVRLTLNWAERVVGRGGETWPSGLAHLHARLLAAAADVEVPGASARHDDHHALYATVRDWMGDDTSIPWSLVAVMTLSRTVAARRTDVHA